jgi:hypothetical protein
VPDLEFVGQIGLAVEVRLVSIRPLLVATAPIATGCPGSGPGRRASMWGIADEVTVMRDGQTKTVDRSRGSRKGDLRRPAASWVYQTTASILLPSAVLLNAADEGSNWPLLGLFPAGPPGRAAVR